MPDVKVRVTGEDAGGSEVLQNVGDAARTAGEHAENLADVFSGKVVAAFGLAEGAIGLAGKALEGLKEIVSDSLQLAREHEVAVVKMGLALQNAGIQGDAAHKSFVELAQALQDSTGVDKDKIASAETMLAQLGLQAARIPEVTKLSLDYATVLGGDATTAARMLGDAIETGHIGRLRLLLPLMDQHAFQIADVDERMRMLSEHFQGAAAAAMDTHAGHIQRIANEWKDAKETLGSYLLELADKAVEAVKNHEVAVRSYFALITSGATEETAWVAKHILGRQEEKKSIEEVTQAIKDQAAAQASQPEQLQSFDVGAAARKNDAAAAAASAQARKMLDIKVQAIDAELKAEADAAKNEQDIEFLNFEEERKIAIEANKKDEEQRKQYWANIRTLDKENRQAELDELKKLIAEEQKEHAREVKEFTKAGIDLGKGLIAGIQAGMVKDAQGRVTGFDAKSALKAVLPMIVEAVMAMFPQTAAFAPLAGAATALVVQQMRRGGWVQNMSGGVQTFGTVGEDTEPAMLSPGERVLSHAEVWAMGGHSAVDAAAAGGGGGPGLSVSNYIAAIDAQSFSLYMGGRGGRGLVQASQYGHGETAQLFRRGGVGVR